MAPSIIEYKTHYSKRFNFYPEWWMKQVPEPSSWTDLNISRFLRLYKLHPALWDPSNPGYNSNLARHLSYRHIAQKLQLNEVDERACIKLVQDLKKRYIKEKEFSRVSEKERPEWFSIIDGIVKRVLDLATGKDSASFTTCEECSCADKQSVLDSFAEHQDCRAQQGLVAPCQNFSSPQASLDGREQKTGQEETCKRLQPSIPSDRPGVNVVMLKLQSCYREEKEDSCGCPDSTDESDDDPASGSIGSSSRQSEQSEQSSEGDSRGSYLACCFKDLSSSEEELCDPIDVKPNPFTNLWDETDEHYDKPISMAFLPDDLDSMIGLHGPQHHSHEPYSSVFCPLQMNFF